MNKRYILMLLLLLQSIAMWAQMEINPNRSLGFLCVVRQREIL